MRADHTRMHPAFRRLLRPARGKVSAVTLPRNAPDAGESRRRESAVRAAAGLPATAGRTGASEPRPDSSRPAASEAAASRGLCLHQVEPEPQPKPMRV